MSSVASTITNKALSAESPSERCALDIFMVDLLSLKDN